MVGGFPEQKQDSPLICSLPDPVRGKRAEAAIMTRLVANVNIQLIN